MRKKKNIFALILLTGLTAAAQDSTLIYPTQKGPFYKHYYETTYGVWNNKHYWGFQYDYMPTQFGLHTAITKGIGNNGVACIIGPSYMLYRSVTGQNWQGYAGVGYSFGADAGFASQIGIRYSFERDVLTNTEYLSLTTGVQFLNSQWMPFIGCNVAPAALKLKEWWDSKESPDGFPRHYSNFLGGYMNGSFCMGADYAYMPAKLGFYASALVNFDLDWCFNVGPSLRLTNSDDTPIDIHVYQGIGAFNGKWGGETGIRFGFERERSFQLWSLSLGVSYSSEGHAIYAGLSWPITAASVVIVGATVGVIGAVMGGGDPSTIIDPLTDLVSSDGKPSSYQPQQTTSSTSPTMSSTTSNLSKNVDCSVYQNGYDDHARQVESLFKSMTRKYDGHVDRDNPYRGITYIKTGNTVTKRANIDTFKKHKNLMRDLKRRALKNGCTIQPSPWEDAEISTAPYSDYNIE